MKQFYIWINPNMATVKRYKIQVDLVVNGHRTIVYTTTYIGTDIEKYITDLVNDIKQGKIPTKLPNRLPARCGVSKGL